MGEGRHGMSFQTPNGETKPNDRADSQKIFVDFGRTFEPQGRNRTSANSTPDEK